MKIYLPNNVKYIIDKIDKEGYEAFIVGGCVRDSILGIEPNDYDITTNAKPSEIIKIFKNHKLIENGIKHGTVGVIIDNEVYEITTYRLEGEYENNRSPKNVEFTSNISQDLKRRDFTINAIAYNDKVGIIDEFGGIQDIKNKIVKTVGNPDERFNEDGLRIIRAIRFSNKLNFEIESITLDSIYKNAYIIKNISKERITDEFTKIILSKKPQDMMLLYKTGVFKHIGILLKMDIDSYKCFEKEIEVLEKCDLDVSERLAMLEYVIRCKSFEKSNCKEDFDKCSIVENLKYSNKIINEYRLLLEYMLMNTDDIDLVKIKLILNKIGPEKFKKVLKLKSLYYSYCLKEEVNLIDEIIENIKRIEEKNECYKIKDLNIDGNELRKLGYRGKEIGEKLNFLLNKVMENPNYNKKEILIGLL